MNGSIILINGEQCEDPNVQVQVTPAIAHHVTGNVPSCMLMARFARTFNRPVLFAANRATLASTTLEFRLYGYYGGS